MNMSWLIAQASATADLESVRQLLDQTPELVHSYSADGWTYLHRAAQFGRTDIAELLLRYGADVNARAHNGLANTPVLCAVIGQHSDMVKLLLTRGADITLPNGAGSTSLHKAAINGDCSMMRLLLAHGAHVDARNTGGQTPLVHAQFLGHVEAVAMLQQELTTIPAASVGRVV
jgi:ankyrin repeat protein